MVSRPSSSVASLFPIRKEQRATSHPGILLRGLIYSIRMEPRSDRDSPTGRFDGSLPGNDVSESDPM